MSMARSHNSLARPDEKMSAERNMQPGRKGLRVKGPAGQSAYNKVVKKIASARRRRRDKIDV
jgi:hypothetical protein